MKPVYISSLSFLPVLTTFKHNFLARSLLSAYQCRGYLHDDGTSKFTEKKEKIVEGINKNNKQAREESNNNSKRLGITLHMVTHSV